MTPSRTGAGILEDRQREIFRHLVEAFITSGEPVGSRTLSQLLPMALSPASIRNVMADLETMGLLYAPHTSAGRVPTEKGLRLFVDGLLQIGELDPAERAGIEARMSGSGHGVEEVLTQATTLLSGLSRCAGLVVAAKQDSVLKHVEFVSVAPGKTLVVMVAEDGQVENRLIDTPIGLPASALSEASNYLNARLRGRTLDVARSEILGELEGERAELDALTAKIVAEGLATLATHANSEEKVLIVRGASHLLETMEAQSDLERVRTLFDEIERKNDLIRLLELAKEGDGVRIFIGSENRLFGLSGSSIVAAPYANAQGKIVGVIGVLGPTRLNYGRIIPMVDHTAKVIGRLLGQGYQV
ncbi:MAG: heat-inducible transcriptional repressor HrcA [Alphaproteobacteria bacterium]|nr:heat-inducible transcriptional repressor HrcA [Alphaproteobacteria bacterium]MDE1986885.1 heat-inducible transcriptional repressor HrcA [Alphaproteobacteria bacterium]MDE2161648.1 heat-inducible transcriptional repressor HrcA [Alphaproteobacteria bacterium]MDE2266710.1 heat-inducible transcriptional repressor HrcA [Alphaproteobacteria bacterium]MDE2500236.1 heat-inducible transcriptional repressor HrcA [Alphaproteobacteria bacterium]